MHWRSPRVAKPQRWRWPARQALALILGLALGGCSSAGTPAGAPDTSADAALFERLPPPTHDHRSHQHEQSQPTAGPTAGHDHTAAGHAHSAPAETSSPADARAEAINWLEGSGETSTGEVYLEPGLILIHLQHPSDTPFAVFLLDEEGTHLAMLANNSVAISGTRAFGIQRAGSYALHVLASDAWRAGFEQPHQARPAAPLALPQHLRGSQPQVLGPLQLEPGSLRLSWSHAGAFSFQLRLLTNSGAPVQTLAEATGPLQGSAQVTIESAGTYLLDVGADGPWELSVER